MGDSASTFWETPLAEFHLSVVWEKRDDVEEAVGARERDDLTQEEDVSKFGIAGSVLPCFFFFFPF